MKNLILTLIVLFSFGAANAQKSFEKGSIVLNTGTNLLAIDGNTFRPGLLVSVDFGVHDYVSVGPYAGVNFRGNKSTRAVIGARSSFHFWQLADDRAEKDLKQDQIDFYLTLFLGGDIFTEYDGPDNNRIRNRGYVYDAGLNLGLRWYPKANNVFALYTELGYTPISYGVIGAAFKLR